MRQDAKKPYQAPVIKTASSSPPAVLLVCSGQYNCVGEVGYNCCQPTAATCFTNC